MKMPFLKKLQWLKLGKLIRPYDRFCIFPNSLLKCAQLHDISSSDTAFYNYLQHAYKNLANVGNDWRVHSPSKQAWPSTLFEALGNRADVSWSNLEVIIAAIDRLDCKFKDLNDITSLLSEVSQDKTIDEKEELKAIAEAEKSETLQEIQNCNEDIKTQLFNVFGNDSSVSSTVMEITPGVGGQEAMLFAAKLFHMYESLCSNMSQEFEILDYDQSEYGGLYKATATVTFSSEEFYNLLRHESGVHRVQRVPVTEKAGRIHTSTASVVFLPVFDTKPVILQEKDLEIKPVKKSNSSGGQHANKTESAVRIKHIPSGKVVECNFSRSQHENKARALQLLEVKLSVDKINEQQSELSKVRRQQVTSRERSDKIRTYNFHQDRVTEHRLGYTVHDVNGVMEGQEPLLNIMKKLEEKYKMEEICAIIATLLEEGNKFYNLDFT